MKTFIRDFRILFISIRHMFLTALLFNMIIPLIMLLFDKVIGSENFAIPLSYLGGVLIIFLNMGLFIGFLLKYFIEWRPLIHDEFKQARLQNKYKFFTERFK